MRKEHQIVSIFIVTIIPCGARRKARFIISSGANVCTARDFHEDRKASVIVSIEGFHSRGQHLCKFIGTKEIVYIRKDFSTPIGLVWYTNMAAISLFWNTNMTAVTSCQTAPQIYRVWSVSALTSSHCRFPGSR